MSIEIKDIENVVIVGSGPGRLHGRALHRRAPTSSRS